MEALLGSVGLERLSEAASRASKTIGGEAAIARQALLLAAGGIGKHDGAMVALLKVLGNPEGDGSIARWRSR